MGPGGAGSVKKLGGSVWTGLEGPDAALARSASAGATGELELEWKEPRPPGLLARAGSSAREGLRSLWSELGGEPFVLLVGGALLMTLGHYQGSTGFFRKQLAPLLEPGPLSSVLPYFWWYGSRAVLYLGLPLLLSRLTGGSFHNRYGLGLGDVRLGTKWALGLLAVMLPVVVTLAVTTTTFGKHYPLAGRGAYETVLPDGSSSGFNLGLFVAYELAYLTYFVSWEFFCRGWLLQGLLPRFGAAGAVLIPMLPFALLHFGKPQPEALGSIVAGVVLGVLALRTRSFWYGAAVHGLVAVAMDVAAVSSYLLRR